MTEAARPWAALFPGQGSQAVGMGRDLAAAWPTAAEVFRAADDALGEPLSRLIFEGPEEELRMTRNTQPALLTVSTAAWRVLASRVHAPVAAAGHSLGEYSALVAAGVLEFEDALRAVRLRGEAMQDAVPPGQGAMAAIIGLDGALVEDLCRRVRRDDEVLVPANYNAPDQVVVAGHAAAVERIAGEATRSGAKKVVSLPVSAPFHCPLMAPAQERLAGFLERLDFAPAAFPVVANVDAAVVRCGGDARRRLIEQVTAPVRWVEGSLALEREIGAQAGVEIGVGRVLTGLSRRINERLKVVPFAAPEDLDRVLELLGPRGA